MLIDVFIARLQSFDLTGLPGSGAAAQQGGENYRLDLGALEETER